MATGIRFQDSFKRMVVEESLSGSATRALLSRQNNIFPQPIIRWRKECTAGKLACEIDPYLPVRDARIRKLKQMAGRLDVENELPWRLAERRFIHSLQN